VIVAADTSVSAAAGQPLFRGGAGGGGGSEYVDPQADFVSAWSNPTGQAPSIDLTLVLRPAATTQPASHVTATGATLHATLNSRALLTHHRFDYGTSTSYGATTPTLSAGAGPRNCGLDPALAPLPVVNYDCRIVALSSAGTTTGADRNYDSRPLRRPRDDDGRGTR
jgi:hypothetical protein